MRQCVFCSEQAHSLEDAWPRWLMLEEIRSYVIVADAVEPRRPWYQGFTPPVGRSDGLRRERSSEKIDGRL